MTWIFIFCVKHFHTILTNSLEMYLLLTFSIYLHNRCRTEYLATASLFKQVTKSQKCSIVLFSLSLVGFSRSVAGGTRWVITNVFMCKELCGRQRGRGKNGEGEKCRKKNRGSNWKKEGVRDGVMCKKRGQCSWQANKTCRELQRKWAFFAHT